MLWRNNRALWCLYTGSSMLGWRLVSNRLQRPFNHHQLRDDLRHGLRPWLQSESFSFWLGNAGRVYGWLNFPNSLGRHNRPQKGQPACILHLDIFAPNFDNSNVGRICQLLAVCVNHFCNWVGNGFKVQHIGSLCSRIHDRSPPESLHCSSTYPGRCQQHRNRVWVLADQVYAAWNVVSCWSSDPVHHLVPSLRSRKSHLLIQTWTHQPV